MTSSIGQGLRLPAYIVPGDQTPPVVDTLVDDSQPDAPDSPGAPDSGDRGESLPPDDTWSNLPTAPQPVVTVSAIAETRSGPRASITGLLIAIGLVAAVGLTSVVVLRLVGAPERTSTATDAPDQPGASGSDASSPNVVSGPLGAIQSAEFQLTAGVTAVTVRAVDIGDDLYRAATPEGSGFAPRVVQDGAKVQLRLVRLDDSDGRDSVTIELNTRVQWRVSMIAGSESATVDMRAANLAGVDFVGGVARIEMWLPEPRGNVPVRMSGGVRDFVIHAPDRVGIRVRLARGAAAVTVDRAKRSGVASGTQLTPAGWDKAPNRYDIDAVAGLAVLTVDRY
jgi:hypothetical protein